MSRTPISRIAYVQYSPHGTSYPTQCSRSDIVEGSEVEVLLRAGSHRAAYQTGTVTAIELKRWRCSGKVVGLASESDASFDLEGLPQIALILAETAKYNYRTARNEMRDIYDAVCADDGTDAYLGDGIWLSRNGSYADKGR